VPSALRFGLPIHWLTLRICYVHTSYRSFRGCFKWDINPWRAKCFIAFTFQMIFGGPHVRNIGFIEGSKPVSADAWEDVKKGGDTAIEKWIVDQLDGRSCAVVLVGSETANRKWVIHEIVVKRGCLSERCWIHPSRASPLNRGFPLSEFRNP